MLSNLARQLLSAGVDRPFEGNSYDVVRPLRAQRLAEDETGASEFCWQMNQMPAPSSERLSPTIINTKDSASSLELS